MTNLHAIPPELRERVIVAASAMADLWGQCETLTLHGTKPDPGNWHWELGEVRCHRVDGRIFGISAEQIYSEQGVDEDFEATFEQAAEATAPVGATAQTFDAAEPWLALVETGTHPRLVWRTTTATPISYDEYVEWEAE